MSTRIEGRVLRRGDYGYESRRREACWHAGVPDRYPEVIVLANNEADVVAAVRLAGEEGLQIAVRSVATSGPGHTCVTARCSSTCRTCGTWRSTGRR